ADVYKHYMEVKLGIGGADPGFTTQGQYDASGTTAQTLLRFSREGAHIGDRLAAVEDLGPPSPRATTRKTLEMVVHWAHDSWGNWRLDIQKTAGASGSGPS